MSHYNCVQRPVLKAIDFKTTGATTIFTTENGTERFHPLYVCAELTAATSVSVVPTISVGTNASSYNNILTATALTNFTAANKMQNYPISVLVDSVAANTAILVNVSIGATATTCTGKVAVIGYYD